jgi:hypothetical protein
MSYGIAGIDVHKKMLAVVVLRVPYAGSRAIAAPTGGERQRPIIRSTTHAPDQTRGQPQLLHCEINLAAPSLSHSAFDSELFS